MARLALACILLGTCALAQADDSFQQIKSRMSEQLELQIRELQKAQACVTVAQEMSALKKCHFQRRAGLRNLKAQMQEKYKDLTPRTARKKTDSDYMGEFID